MRSADALGWALTRAGRPRDGLRVGAARAAARLARPAVPLPRGHRRAARRRRAASRGARLRARWRGDPRFSPLYAPRRAGCWRRCDEAARARSALLAPRSRRSLGAGARRAHPLGNFSINHLSTVRISRRPRRRPLRARPGRDPDLPGARRCRDAAVLARKRAEVARRLQLTRRRAARSRCAVGAPAAARSRPAQGGLPHDAASSSRSRRRVRDAAPRRAARRHVPRPRRLEGGRRRARARAPPCARRAAGDPTDGLRRYPADLLSSPLDRARRELRRAAGRRHAHAPRGAGRACHDEPRRATTASPALFADAAAGRGRAAAAAARRVRLGRAARALARARQGDGRGLPGRHARHGAPRRRARRDGDDRRTRSASSRSAS